MDAGANAVTVSDIARTGAEVVGKAQQIRKDPGGRHLRARARALYNERIGRVTVGLELHDIVGQVDIGERMVRIHGLEPDRRIPARIESGDVLSNANTIILMGKYRDGLKMHRALSIAKHRGSACDESIIPFEITRSGIVLA